MSPSGIFLCEGIAWWEILTLESRQNSHKLFGEKVYTVLGGGGGLRCHKIFQVQKSQLAGGRGGVWPDLLGTCPQIKQFFLKAPLNTKISQTCSLADLSCQQHPSLHLWSLNLASLHFLQVRDQEWGSNLQPPPSGILSLETPSSTYVIKTNSIILQVASERRYHNKN